VDKTYFAKGFIVERTTYTFDSLAREGPQIRAPFFEAAARARSLSPIILEKDFWVCWTLRRLFEEPKEPETFIFKGGTSLSKVYAAIGRFSEDIDILIDRAIFGYSGDNDVTTELTNSKRQRTLDNLDMAVSKYIESTLLGALRERFSQLLGSAGWTLEIDKDDPYQATLLFGYPTEMTRDELPYIAKFVRIEMGGRPDRWPSGRRTIRAYIAESFPDSIQDADVWVNVLDIKRTFWEKATILHAYAHYPLDKTLPSRASRHYSDLAALVALPSAEEALARGDLLAAVVQNKTLFYEDKKASYETAVPGTFRLLPPEARIEELKGDYRAMRPMFFDEPPSWDTLSAAISNLERNINAMPTVS
jgi:hypothetical protein